MDVKNLFSSKVHRKMFLFLITGIHLRLVFYLPNYGENTFEVIPSLNTFHVSVAKEQLSYLHVKRATNSSFILGWVLKSWKSAESEFNQIITILFITFSCTYQCYRFFPLGGRASQTNLFICSQPLMLFGTLYQLWSPPWWFL